jgi:hypothetical protein
MASHPLHIDDINASPLSKERIELNVADIMNIPKGNEVYIPRGSLPDIIDLPDPKPQQGMKVHIELESTTKDGHLRIRADVDSQEDLVVFQEMYKEYMPKKKWLGLI